MIALFDVISSMIRPASVCWKSRESWYPGSLAPAGTSKSVLKSARRLHMQVHLALSRLTARLLASLKSSTNRQLLQLQESRLSRKSSTQIAIHDDVYCRHNSKSRPIPREQENREIWSV
jgi:hypothetical protein